MNDEQLEIFYRTADLPQPGRREGGLEAGYPDCDGRYCHRAGGDAGIGGRGHRLQASGGGQRQPAFGDTADSGGESCAALLHEAGHDYDGR